MKKSLNRALVLLLMAFSVQQVSAAEKTVDSHAPQLPLSEIQSFVETFETIKEGYVDQLSDQQILDRALKGMVAALDPHSEYMTKDEVADFEDLTSGNYAGVGVEVEMKDGKLTVVSPIDGSPAKQAGILSGDVIVKVGTTYITDLGFQDVMNLMRGEVGTKVTLDIERDGQIKHFTLERRLVEDESVTSKWLSKGIAYIRIKQFQGDTGTEFHQAIAKLEQEQPINGVVLDLRNNPGGVLQAAVKVVDTFIENGMIVYTDGRHKLSKSEFKATAKNTQLPKVPLVVLINDGSASASEIVAGALQDHKRALIMGTESFGKGSVQTVVPLSDGAAVKLTTALYYTPNGRSIQAQGITPDLVVPEATLTLNKDHFVVKEAELKGHLSNGTGGADRTDTAGLLKLSEVAKKDFQLFQALTILQTLPSFDYHPRETK
ncbi:S41 family peptidase [Marinomonas pollencensis]|uniref:Carboxyl-terminal processing protease n=1 Tax=Marinomonas pollencensis TaxID=491954 RepID=A0A3E0DIW3_9GAMM|nr:S41 family peptidase [Marinomonas pollencensis]REG82656.1 carboxyl-terminal processing protease [Marinomonas pollencensis]